MACLLARKAGAGSGGENGGKGEHWLTVLAHRSNVGCTEQVGGLIWPTGCNLLTPIINNLSLSSNLVFLSLTLCILLFSPSVLFNSKYKVFYFLKFYLVLFSNLLGNFESLFCFALFFSLLNIF